MTNIQKRQQNNPTVIIAQKYIYTMTLPLTTLCSERRELAYDKLCSYVSGQREHRGISQPRDFAHGALICKLLGHIEFYTRQKRRKTETTYHLACARNGTAPKDDIAVRLRRNQPFSLFHRCFGGAAMVPRPVPLQTQRSRRGLHMPNST